jgi:spore germination cell wall hydrolase CwlJ-like protein
MATQARRRSAARTRERRRSRTEALLLLAFAALVLFAWLAARGGWFAPPRPKPPKLTMEQARAVNASIPFAGGGLAAAKPFHFSGTPAAREQAVQCLATAALYEAGGDERGRRAVIQVILNRLRLPGFPKTVCGVVYQGAALPTGCQFSFTCDGSRMRRPEHDGWPEARVAARRALDGYVFSTVGGATHYHADWVVPYWISSLDKIARVSTHLFYRPHVPYKARDAADAKTAPLRMEKPGHADR